MAELMKILETSGAFTSDLIKELVYQAPQSSSLSIPSTSSSFHSQQADVNLNIGSSTTEFPQELSSTDDNMNANDNRTFTSSSGNMGNSGFRTSTNISLTNINVESAAERLRDLNSNANTVEVITVGTDISPGVTESAEARPLTCDPNANSFVDTNRILSEVKESPSASRKLLLDQVTHAIIEAHMSTTINTHVNVAEANKRIHREKNEMPDVYSLSLNGNTFWQHFMAAMLPEITKVIQFFIKLPGFPELGQDDRICLIRQGCFEVMVTRFCILIDHDSEEMLAPTLKMKAPRNIVQDTPMGEFLDQFFNVASKFNPLGLTDEEISIFTAVIIMYPDREGLKNPATVKVIQKLFLQSLYLLLKQNHTDADRILSSLISLLPVLRKINEEHLRFLRMIKMKSPAEYEKKFPTLHKELFDITS